MKKLLNVKNLIVALVLVVGLTGIASFVSAVGPIANIQYAGKDSIEITPKEVISIWHQEFENQNVEIDILDYESGIKLSILKPNGQKVEGDDLLQYYEIIQDDNQNVKKIKLKFKERLFKTEDGSKFEDGVYTIKFGDSETPDFEIRIIVDYTSPKVNVYLGGSGENSKIESEDQIKEVYTNNQLRLTVEDEHFNPEMKDAYHIWGIKTKDKAVWDNKGDYWETTVELADNNNQRLNVIIKDQLGNINDEHQYRTEFIVDTKGPKIEVSIENSGEKLVPSNNDNDIYKNIKNLIILIEDANELDLTNTYINIAGQKYMIDATSNTCEKVESETRNLTCTLVEEIQKNRVKVKINNLPNEKLSINVVAKDKFADLSDKHTSSFSLKNLIVDTNAPVIESITFNDMPYNSNEINNYNQEQTVRLVIDETYLDKNNLKVNLKMLLKEQIAQQDFDVQWTEDNGKHVASVKFDSDGEYRLDFEVYDLAENKTSSDIIAFEIDQTPPKIKLSATNHNKIDTEGDNPINLGFYNDKLTIKAEIIEEHLESTTYSLTRVEDNSKIPLDHFNNQELDVTFNDPDSNSDISLEDGNYELDINVKDGFGNVLNEKITFTIDNTKPVVSPYSYTNDNEEVKPNQNNETGILYFDKNIDVKFNVEDKNLDLEASKITITKKVESTEKVESTVYSLSQLSDPEDSFIKSIKLPTFDKDGEYQIELSNIQDKAGNDVEPKITKIVIDTKAPNIQIKDQEGFELKSEFEEDYFYNQLVLNLSISDDNHNSSSETYSLERKDDESNIPIEIFKDEPINNHKLELNFNNDKSFKFMTGEYTLTVNAQDQAGNETVKKIKFTIDRTAPVVFDYKYIVDGQEVSNDQLKGDNRIFYFNKNTLVTFEVTEQYLDLDNSKLSINEKTYSLNELKIEKAGMKSIIQLPVFDADGSYQISLDNVQDEAGNVGNTIDLMTIIIDKTAPVLNFNTQCSELLCTTFTKDTQEINFSIDDTNYKKLNYSIEHKDYVTGDLISKEDKEITQSSFDRTLTDGKYVVNFTAEDLAGNVTTIGGKIIVDQVKPVVFKYELDNPIRQDQDSGIRYYSKGQELKVYIEEYHFDDKKVEINLTYRSSINDKNEKEIKLNPKSEKVDNAQYVATIKVEEDGYYELNHVDVTDQVGNEEEVKAVPQKFVIDKVKPTIEVSDVKDKFYYKKGDKVTINGSIDEINFNPNLSTYTIYRKESLNSEEKVYLSGKITPKISGEITSKTDFTLPTLTENGEYRVVLTAKDMSDNQVEKDTKLHFYIDHHDPKVSIKPVTTNTANGSQQNVSEVVIGLSATDDWKLANTKYTVKRNNEVINVPKQGEWEDFKLSFKDEGYYQVEIETGDEAGTKTVKETLEFTIDRTSPAQLSIVGNANHHNSTTSVKDGESYSAPRVNLQFTAEDAYSFNKITVDVTKNGKAYASQTFDVKDVRKDFTNAFGKNANYSLSEEGEYEVTFTAYDQAGNQSNQKLSFEIDRTKPIITSNIEDGKYYNEDFLPEFTLDQPERDEFTFINIDGVNYKGRIPFLISDKVYTISALATDKAQNTVDYNATITIDKTSPTIGISNLITGFFKDTLSPSIFYNDTNLDASKVSIKLNNIELGAGVGDENGYTKAINIDKDGKYTLEVSIGDLATNVSKQTIDFVLDNEKPVINIKNNISGELFNKAWLPELEVLEEYGYDIVVATLNGEEYDLTQPITREGKNVLYIQVMDKSGNLDEITVEFILDLTPPKVIIENAQTNELVKDGDDYETSLDLKVYLDYVSQEGQLDTERIYDISLNGESIPLNNVTKENGRTVYHLSLTEFKDYNLTVKASDDAGNKTVETITFTLGDKNIFTKIYENKPVFYSIITITGLSVLIAGIYTIRILKKKNNEETEE